MADWRHAGITDTRQSRHAVLAGPPLRDVTPGDGFWRPRLEANRTAALPKLYELLCEHGAVDNLLRLAGKDIPRSGLKWSDSDLAKWLEGAAYVLQTTDDPELRAMADEAAHAFEVAQGDDGYLNSWFVDERAGDRFRRLGSDHELYCAGHFFQAAVAHHRIDGGTQLLDVATRYADYLCEQFGPGRIEQTDGHPEIELALVELYRATGHKRYLTLSQYLTNLVGLRDMPSVAGHAVRALYFCAGGADLVAETGDDGYARALEHLWQDLTHAKMYVTGAVGSRYAGEAVGEPYELPNLRAYAETCAAAANAFWNWRMLQIRPEARFADVMELALYNGFLAGVSLSGTEYFYTNPLATYAERGHNRFGHQHRGENQRQAWHSCTCCPTNVVRVLPSMPGYQYGVSDRGLYVHLYDAGVWRARLADGRAVTVGVDTAYPWDGDIAIELQPETPGRFELALRIPGWCRSPKLSVAGEALPDPLPGSYTHIDRVWQPGDQVRLRLPMEATLLTADPHLRETLGSLAVQRGPLIYCLESVDHPGASVFDLWVEPSTRFRAQHRPDLLGGVTVLHAALPHRRQAAGAPLYRPVGSRDLGEEGLREATLIPYYAWANRGPSAMTVWLPRADLDVG